VPRKDRLGLHGLLVEQLVVVDAERAARVELAHDVGGAALVHGALQRRLVDARQHGVDDAEVRRLDVEALRHVTVVALHAPHELLVAAHERVVHGLDGRELLLGEELGQRHVAVAVEGRRRAVGQRVAVAVRARRRRRGRR